MEEPQGEKLLYTAEDAGFLLSIGRTVVFELMASDRLRSVNIGRSRRIAKDELTRFVDELYDLRGEAEMGPATEYPEDAA